MKTFFLILLQFFLFLITFAVGSFARPLHLSWDLAVATSPNVHRTFVPDGLLLALGLFLVIAIIQIVRKRLSAAAWTTLAFLLAIVTGYAMQLGFVTRDL